MCLNEAQQQVACRFMIYLHFLLENIVPDAVLSSNVMIYLVQSYDLPSKVMIYLVQNYDLPIVPILQISVFWPNIR